ncbi:hypothetical protein PG996_009742 [Apiospora saccharicola]|uniref:Rhodopsin domain-containing protein n=1 Tax=Apiospora saccharicola TaxID=335842 RepID=A0ABR1UMB1_9PEZI
MPPAPVNDVVPGRGYNPGDDKGTSTLITIWLVTTVAFAFTAGRLYVRGYIQRRLRSDDYLTIFSMVNSIVACGLATKAVTRGLGRHLQTLSLEDQSASLIWTFAAFFPGLVSFACPKLAVIALLVRLLLPSRFHFCFLWFMGVAVQLAQLGTMGLLISDLVENCKLSDSASQTQKQKGNCVPMHTQVRYYLFAGSLSAFADFYLAAYPSIVLYHLQMPGRKKLALSVALGCGVVVEGAIIVIASSIPILQPLIDKAFGTSIMGRPHAYFTKYKAMFSDRRKIATTVRRRIRDNQVTTTTTDFTTTTMLDELAPVHRMDSGIDDPEMGAKPDAAKRVATIEVTEEARDDSGKEGPSRADLPTTVVVTHTASSKK